MNAINQVHLNTLLSEAEVCCATLYPKLSSFFRAPPVAAGRRGGGEATAAEWNGKSTASATSTCDAYNLGHDHQARHLLPDGTCKFVPGFTCVFSTNAILGCPVQTRTGLNAATDMTGFRFALTALDEISWFFSTDTFMRVSDVADTFFNVPLHPNVWPFFCRFFSAPDSVVEHFYLHTSADFGAAGMPGIFRLLCVRCVF